MRVDDFLGVRGVGALWQFHEVDEVLGVASEVGLKSVETVVRYPYDGVEHPSKRAYLTVER